MRVANVGGLGLVLLSLAVLDFAASAEIQPPGYILKKRIVDTELNYHRVLGTTLFSTQEQIRESFRYLSRVYFHTPEFNIISEAYKVLANPRTRKIYEQGGLHALWGYDDPKFEDPLRDPFQIQSKFDHGSFSMSFGFQAGDDKKSPTVSHQIKLPLENFITGISLSISIVRKELCPICNGTGGSVAAELLTCPVCHGKRTHSHSQKIKPGHAWEQTFTKACKKCDGTGQIATVPCPHCEGARVVDGKKDVTIKLEPGCPEGHPFEFVGEAEQIPGAQAGNVILTVYSKPHPLFQREGADLVCEKNITLMQALMGFEMEAVTIDGRTITVRRDDVSKPGSVHEVENEGMPVYQDPGKKGKMKIKLNIVFPERLAITEERKKALRDANLSKKRKKRRRKKRLPDGTEAEGETDDDYEEVDEDVDEESAEEGTAKASNETATDDAPENATSAETPSEAEADTGSQEPAHPEL